MSRIILSRYDNGEEKLVVGWDHPAGGAFWQEFNRETDADGNAIWEYDESWEEVRRFAGMWPGISLAHFQTSLPDDLKPLVTQRVMDLLTAHSENPNSGYNTPPIDLTERNQ